MEGDATANNIRLSTIGDELVVRIDGDQSRFPLEGVDFIFVRAFEGNDDVVNNTSISTYVLAGDGDDYVSGGSGDDFLLGESGEDRMFGRNGQDFLSGGTDTDRLFGGSGNDTIQSYPPDDDRMFGESGDDRLENGAEMSGGSGDDFIISVAEDGFVSGGSGDDRLIFTGSDTTVLGGAGMDEILALSADSGGILALALNDYYFAILTQLNSVSGIGNINGGAGVDAINGELEGPGITRFNRGSVYATGTDLDDSISATLEGGQLVVRVENAGSTFEQTFDPADVTWIFFNGMAGDDTLLNTSDIGAQFVGGPGDDFMNNAGNESSVFRGGTGDDLYMTNTEWDYCFGGQGGNDVYVLNGGYVFHSVLHDPEFRSVTVFGSERTEFVKLNSLLNSGAPEVSRIDLGGGNDVYDGIENDNIPVTVLGRGGADILYGGFANNNERLFGGNGDDFIAGNDGRDILRGEGGMDVMEGGGGSDVMFGGNGNDAMSGGNLFSSFGTQDDENDVLRSEGGDDRLNGGLGDDLLFGGPGNDDLFGEEGDDRLNGEGGFDNLDGGPGVNVLNQ